MRSGWASWRGSRDRDRTQIHNEMEGIVVKAERHQLCIRLDDDHVQDGRRDLVLPGWYAGDHAAYAYAR